MRSWGEHKYECRSLTHPGTATGCTAYIGADEKRVHTANAATATPFLTGVLILEGAQGLLRADTEGPPPRKENGAGITRWLLVQVQGTRGHIQVTRGDLEYPRVLL